MLTAAVILIKMTTAFKTLNKYTNLCKTLILKKPYPSIKHTCSIELVTVPIFTFSKNLIIFMTRLAFCPLHNKVLKSRFNRQNCA